MNKTTTTKSYCEQVLGRLSELLKADWNIGGLIQFRIINENENVLEVNIMNGAIVRYTENMCFVMIQNHFTDLVFFNIRIVAYKMCDLRKKSLEEGATTFLKRLAEKIIN